MLLPLLPLLLLLPTPTLPLPPRPSFLSPTPIPGHSCFPNFTPRHSPPAVDASTLPPHPHPDSFTYTFQNTPYTPSSNPFSHIAAPLSSTPSFVDLDLDGDHDLLLGNRAGGTLYYENVGNATEPWYMLRGGANSPVFGFTSEGYSAGSWGDVDGDGDIDLFLSDAIGRPFFVENNSTYDANGDVDFYFIERKLGTGNPLWRNKFGKGKVSDYRTNAALVDVDGDGDGDLLLADSSGKITLLLNTGKERIVNYDLKCRCVTTTYKPMYREDDITHYFPHVHPPIAYPVTQPDGSVKAGPYSSDSLMFAYGDVDNDGAPELLRVFGGKILFYDDVNDFTFGETQQRYILDAPAHNLGSTGGGAPIHVAVVDVNGDGRNDIVVGSQDGFVRYYEADGFECMSCPRGSFVPPLPSPPACTPCGVGFYTASENATECLTSPPGFFSINPATIPVACSAGTVNSIYASTMCFDCPAKEKACVGGSSCEASRMDPGTLCVQCKHGFFKTANDECEVCHASTNVLETSTGALLLLAIVLGGRHLSCKVDGFFYATTTFDFLQLWLVLMLTGQTVVAPGSSTMAILAFMTSTLLHPDFLHLDCEFPNLNFAHKLMFFLTSVGAAVGALLVYANRTSRKLDAERDEFHAELEEQDGIRNLGRESEGHEIQRADTLLKKAQIYSDELRIRKTKRNFILLLHFCHGPLILHLSRIFGCTRIDVENNLVMEADPRIHCSNPLYLSVESITRVMIVGLVFLPSAVVLKTVMDIKLSYSNTTSATMDNFGPLVENYTPTALPFFESLRVLRRALTIAALSNLQTIVPFLASVESKCVIILLINGAYLAVLVLLRPYNRKLFFLYDLGLTSFMCVGSLSTLAAATGNDLALQVGVYFLTLSSWGFMGFTGFVMWSHRRLMASKKLFDLEQVEERTLLDKLAPYDHEKLHAKSRKLLDRFINLACSAKAAAELTMWQEAREFHAQLTEVQAKLMVSLPEESGLRHFSGSHFKAEEHLLKPELAALVKTYRQVLDDLHHDTDHKNFEQYLRTCVSTYDANCLHKKGLQALLVRSLHNHDYTCSMDVRNELVLFVYNIEPAVVDDWKCAIHAVIDNFQTGNYDDFNKLEQRLLNKIRGDKKRQDAKNLSRQRVRELLMKKCDVTCRKLEREWCEFAWKCTMKNQVVDIYRFVEVWCDEAQGFGLPEDVEERLIEEKKRGGRDAHADKTMHIAWEEEDDEAGGLHRQFSSIANLGGGLGGGGGGSGKGMIDEQFLAFKNTLQKKDDGIVSLADIKNKVKLVTKEMRHGIFVLSNRVEVDPSEVFRVVKDKKEELDRWIFEAEESLWSYELKAMLKGQPVLVKVYQRLQMDCRAAQHCFIRGAQKAMDEGKDLILLDEH